MYEIILGRSRRAREKYGLRGTIYLGKHYIKMGEHLSLANDVHMDIGGPHVILVSGKRGSGKSYSLGVIAEGLVGLQEDVSKNLACLIFDTMGLYWTMRYPNYRDDKLLSDWNLKAKKLEPVVFVPKGLARDYEVRGVKFEERFSLKPIDVGAENWANLFEIDLNSEEGLLLERAINKLKDSAFSLDDITTAVMTDKSASKHAQSLLLNRFTAAKEWGIFDKEGTQLSKLFVGGQTSVLDLSAYTQIERGAQIKALVIGLLCDKMLKTRLLARKEEEAKLIDSGAYLTEKEAFAGEKSPLIWILIDEAHEFIPNNKETLASAPLIRILREGRQPGLTLVLATQQPGSIAADALTQADIVLSHRLTAKIDIEALGDVMQTYLPHELRTYIRQLPGVKGCGVILDDKLERIYPVQIRPRTSWHGGAEPTAMTKEMLKDAEADAKLKEF